MLTIEFGRDEKVFCFILSFNRTCNDTDSVATCASIQRKAITAVFDNTKFYKFLTKSTWHVLLIAVKRLQYSPHYAINC